MQGWEDIYNARWTAEFINIVKKRVPYSSENAEETVDEVRQELAVKLSDLKLEPDSVNAYIRSAFRNSLEDYIRKKQGYPRPPEWIKRLGAAYERIYKLLCLENRSVNDIHAIMTSLYHSTRVFVERVISEVRAGVTNCGAWRESVNIDDNMHEVDEINSNQEHLTPETILQDMDANAVVNTIFGNQKKIADRNAMLRSLVVLRQCELTDDERLLLRMVYAEGHSVSKAARLLKLADAQTRKLLKDLLQRLNQALKDAGIVFI